MPAFSFTLALIIYWHYFISPSFHFYFHFTSNYIYSGPSSPHLTFTILAYFYGLSEAAFRFLFSPTAASQHRLLAFLHFDDIDKKPTPSRLLLSRYALVYLCFRFVWRYALLSRFSLAFWLLLLRFASPFRSRRAFFAHSARLPSSWLLLPFVTFSFHK